MKVPLQHLVACRCNLTNPATRFTGELRILKAYVGRCLTMVMLLRAVFGQQTRQGCGLPLAPNLNPMRQDFMALVQDVAPKDRLN